MIKIELIKNLRTNATKADFNFLAKKYYKEDKQNAEKFLKGKKGEICVVLCDDNEIKEYNNKFRNKNVATDVLSFVYIDKIYDNKNKHKSTNLGDILISIDTAKRQAKTQKISLKYEVMNLFTHGMLHIFGYDHNNDEEEALMEEVKEKVLKYLK